MMLALIAGALSFTTVSTFATNNQYVRCEHLTDPVEKQECNEEIDLIVQNSIAEINADLQADIQAIMASNLPNKYPLILAAMQQAYSAIWTLQNVTYPLV